ncbi:MAG: hypothetical protein K6G64_03110 [Eubacterium sp.]|nr:hypothetical protein [Eubacterium sp.]
MDSNIFKSTYNERLDSAKTRNKGRDKIGELIKGFSVLILIINIIGTVLLAMGESNLSEIITALKAPDEFSFTILFLGVISSAVIFVILYGIGEIVDRVVSIEKKIKMIKK